MKKAFYINSLFIVLGLLACVAAPVSGAEPPQVNEQQKKDMGYFFGYSFGQSLKQGGNQDVDPESIRRGLNDALAGKDPELTQEQQEQVISIIRARQQYVQEQAQAQMDDTAEDNLARANAFLEENAGREGVEMTDSGLQYKILEEGEGPSPVAEDTVVVHYEGRFLDGNAFDSSRQRGEPAEFQLNRVIAGWTEGLQLMKEGGKARLFIPPDLAYGTGGTRGIPPNSALIFEVELLEVKQGEPAETE